MYSHNGLENVKSVQPQWLRNRIKIHVVTRFQEGKTAIFPLRIHIELAEMSVVLLSNGMRQYRMAGKFGGELHLAD